MLTFILKKEWFEKIKRGEKTVEYREVKPYWTHRIQSAAYLGSLYSESLFLKWLESYGTQGVYTPYAYAKFRLGYTKTCLYAVIDRIAIVDGINTDLKIDKPVYAFCFHLAEN